MARDLPAGPRKTVKGAVIAVVIGVILTLAIAEVALRIVMPHWRDFYSARFMRTEFVNGYGTVNTGRPGFDGYFAQNAGDFRVRISINRFGLREAEPVAAANGRVWIVGDSMAFGWGIDQTRTYTRIAQRESGVATYNVASPGTDICGYQALVARMPKDIAPRAVVVGVILENDMRRYQCPRGKLTGTAPSKPAEGSGRPTLVGLKYFITGHVALYNFAAVTLKRVPVINRLLMSLGLVARSHQALRQPGGPESAATARSSAEELGALKAMLPAGTPFAVLITPTRWEIRDGHEESRRLRETLTDALNRAGIDVIDPIAAFRKAGFQPTHFVHDGHWSALGHEIAGREVARWIGETLKQ